MTLTAVPPATLATQPRALVPPRKEAGRPLMSVLQDRRSTREYSARGLSSQHLSEVLWAAYGITRASGERTAPYWRHIMVLDVYAVMADGAWLYDAANHALLPHLAEDLRGLTGLQDFAACAPLELVYVVHGERMGDIGAEERRLYGCVDAAFAGENVYLYCASEGLASVFRGAVDTKKLGDALKLPAGQFVAFAQTVGHARQP